MVLAIIFDLNGVIVDDEHTQQEAWAEYAKKHSMRFPDGWRTKMIGRTARESFCVLYGRDISDFEYEKFSNERIDMAIALFKKNPRLVKGVTNLLDALSSHKISIAVATSARKRYFDFIMETFNLRRYFTAFITGEDVTKGKPDPEVFLKAAKKLGIEPGNCIVIEDALQGVKAGKAANMKVIGITTTFTSKELYDAGADIVIDDFGAMSVEKLRKLAEPQSTELKS